MLSWRGVAALVAAVAILPVVVSLGVPWAKLEVPGRFSTVGCSGDLAQTEYFAQYMTRVTTGTDAQGRGYECVPLFVFWTSADEDARPGIEKIRAAKVLMLGAIGGAAATLALLAQRGGAARFLGAGVAALAVLAVALGAGLLQSGLLDHAAETPGCTPTKGDCGDRTGDRLSGGSGPGTFSWAQGPLLAYGGAGLLLVSSVLAFLPARAREPRATQGHGAGAHDLEERPAEPGDLAEDGQHAPSTRHGPRTSEWPAAESVGRAGDGRATEARSASMGEPRAAELRASDDGRGPRRLTCPRCHHRFFGEWGIAPRCPSCGFERDNGSTMAGPRAA